LKVDMAKAILLPMLALLIIGGRLIWSGFRS